MTRTSSVGTPIELVDLRREDQSDRTWQPPFDWTVRYENDAWWDGVPYYVSTPWFVQVLQDGAEVARIELAVDAEVNCEYADAPTIGPERLAIQLIEVAAESRGRGIGTQCMQVLTERHPNNRFLAYSEGAERFWHSLGWDRHDHPEGAQLHRRCLFNQRGWISSNALAKATRSKIIAKA